eukprot:TRINITY_DN12220_c0_g1_i1.p1 TRINITY_DN12220_c0_g1~~TRINITY_DN12220_c0_g1_i1.p1  ORF type:complete len:299 (-),score=23.80 TRINITY_DN12220_c0_g1_i1:101-997(-)
MAFNCLGMQAASFAQAEQQLSLELCTAMQKPVHLAHGDGFAAGKGYVEKAVSRPECHAALFALRARQARDGIRAALGVLLGPDYENQAFLFAELCNRDLDKVAALLTQAGCHVTAADAPVIELLFAAATSRHGKTACRMSEHSRGKKSDLAVLLEEDLRWRPGAGGVPRSCPSPLSPQGKGLQLHTGPMVAARAGGAQLVPVPLCSTHLLGVPALGSPLNCPWCASRPRPGSCKSPPCLSSLREWCDSKKKTLGKRESVNSMLGKVSARRCCLVSLSITCTTQRRWRSQSYTLSSQTR